MYGIVMRMVYGLCVLGTVALSGCASSLQPLGSKDVRVDVPGMAGEWVVKESIFVACRKGTQVKIVRLSAGRFDVITKQEGTIAG